ncbi:hypothetical protein P255_02313 [Acinetobacter brisouii CIP 110357]|uniref:Uncharacterized protein n=1 Tax=Acinetobacter brisouii CIP 110357 TaxID=1341683 RepID=V2UK48_9GAMM|nr:hypothetical protein F954_01830 [Acinetobacter brisouii ANC 4119]ESK50337.1 hypothetical protein P255_02313 [Acinetobacter brisouii CIP 110357]
MVAGRGWIAIALVVFAALLYVATILLLVLISRDQKLLKMNFPASLGKTFLP